MYIRQAQYYFHIFVLPSHKHGLHFILLDRLFFQAYNTIGPHLQYLSKIQDWGRQQGVLRLREEILQCWLECLWYNFLLTIKQNDKQCHPAKEFANTKLSTLNCLLLELNYWLDSCVRHELMNLSSLSDSVRFWSDYQWILISDSSVTLVTNTPLLQELYEFHLDKWVVLLSPLEYYIAGSKRNHFSPRMNINIVCCHALHSLLKHQFSGKCLVLKIWEFYPQHFSGGWCPHCHLVTSPCFGNWMKRARQQMLGIWLGTTAQQSHDWLHSVSEITGVYCILMYINLIVYGQKHLPPPLAVYPTSMKLFQSPLLLNVTDSSIHLCKLWAYHYRSFLNRLWVFSCPIKSKKCQLMVFM